MEENQHKVVIVWDLIKNNLKKSEEDEFIRLIGPQLIEKNEELRSELENYMEIVSDLQRSEEESLSQADCDPPQQPTKIFLNKNNEFLEKEISFFISNLRNKAKNKGIDEDMLIPVKNKRDVEIYSYIQNKGDNNDRPISASTRVSSKYCDGYDNERESMSSTFTEGFGTNSNKKIPELPKNKCVLDFNKSENEILKEIAEIIKKEQSELEDEIQNQQDLIMNQGKPKYKPEVSDINQPTSKELFDFKSRLEETYIKSGKDSNQSESAITIQTKHRVPLPSLKSDKFKGPIKILQKSVQEGDSEPENKREERQRNSSQIKLNRAMTTSGAPRKKIKLKKIGDVQEKLGDNDSATKQPPSLSLNKMQSSLPLKIKRSCVTRGVPKQVKETIYGLDVDFLREIGKNDIVEEFEKDKAEGTESTTTQATAIIALEKNFKKVSKLREVCKEMRTYEPQE